MKRFDCERPRGCLDALLDGTLDSDDREALEVHLDVCSACRDFHHGWHEIESVMRDAPLPPLNPDVERRLLAGDEVMATVSRRPRHSWRPLWQASAIAMAILLLSWLLPRLLVPPESPADRGATTTHARSTAS